MGSFQGVEIPRINGFGLGVALAIGSLAAGCVGSLDGPGDSGGGDPGDGLEGPRDGLTPRDKTYEPLQPVDGSMWRLTKTQYSNSIRDIFGVDVTADLEPDEETEKFISIGAAKVGTSSRGVERYQDAAYLVADKILAKAGAAPGLGTCNPAALADPCIEAFVRETGRRLWRRSLTDEEVDRYKAIVGADGATSEKIKVGLRFSLAGLLSSPNFLYVIQVGEPDEQSGAWRYTSIEMASRLAYFIWNTTPDVALLDAGEGGQLLARDSLLEEVDRLLKDARAGALAERYLSESWLVSKLDVTDKNTDVFTKWNDNLLSAYKAEFGGMIKSFAFDDPRDLRQLLTTKQTWTNGVLNAFYGLQGPSEFSMVDLDDNRYGLITSGAVIAANSPSDRTSPTHRGVFVVEKLLCREIPPPPGDVDNTLTPMGGAANETVRERLKRHREDPACSGCHGLFDPAGMTFENFSGMGEFRTQDNGQDIDSSGELDGETFKDVGELAAHVAGLSETGACMVKNLYEYATAHATKEGELGLVELLSDRVGNQDTTFPAMVREVVASAGFRLLTETVAP